MAFSFRLSALAACALALAACAGNHGSGAFTPAALPQSDAASEPDAKTPTVAMKYSIKIPAAKPAMTQAQRHEQFVSASTQSIAFAVYKAGKKHNAKTLLFTKVIALNAGAAGCNKTKTRTCTGTLNLPPPSVDIVATTYDLKPVGKKVSKKARTLAVAMVAKLEVVKNKKIPFTLGGIPVTFTMTIPGATIVSGVQTVTMAGMYVGNTNISIRAFDADGNQIVTDGYVNAAGVSTGVAISETPSQATCSKPVLQADENTAGTQIVVSAPPKLGVFFNYGSNGIAQAFTTPGYCSFAIAAHLVGSSAVQQGKFVLSGPLLAEYSIGSALASPDSIVVGPDNNIWFTDFEGNVGTINVTTKAVSEYPMANVQSIASHGGSLWVMTSGNSLVQMSTSGSTTATYPTTNTGYPNDHLAVDSSGNFWFTQAPTTPSAPQKIAKVTPTGATSEFTVAGSTYPVGITSGADGNIWFTACIGNNLDKITPNAPNTQTVYPVPDLQPGNVVAPYMVASGPDGNLWITSYGGGIIGRVPLPSGSTLNPTYFTAPAPQYRAQMYGIAPGLSADMWAADAANNLIDRIPVGATDASQISSVHVSEDPVWVVAGPDGAIWFTERLLSNSSAPSGKIGRIVP
jgi:streptogramin lyase